MSIQPNLTPKQPVDKESYFYREKPSASLTSVITIIAGLAILAGITALMVTQCPWDLPTLMGRISVIGVSAAGGILAISITAMGVLFLHDELKP